MFINREAFDAWYVKYTTRLNSEALNQDVRSISMKKANPVYVLRNYMAEIAITKARDENDFSEIDVLMQLLKNPYVEQAGFEHYAGHPPEWAQRIEVSCSS